MYAKRGLIVLLLALCAASAIDAGRNVTPPTSQPTSQPTKLAELVDQLESHDPQIRDSAREELMLLTRDDLPALLGVARKAGRLSTMQISLLRDIVQHVYLTEIHQFKGNGIGFIGIPRPADFQDAAVIPERIIGYDGYRVLRDGDTIVGMQLQRNANRQMQTVKSFVELQEFMKMTRPGDWLIVRIIRNGQPMEATLHLAGRDEANGRPAIAGMTNQNPYLQEAQMYWRDSFQPSLNAATTRPAGESAPAD